MIFLQILGEFCLEWWFSVPACCIQPATHPKNFILALKTQVFIASPGSSSLNPSPVSVSLLSPPREETMASNINQVLAILSIASLLALFPQADSTIFLDAPAAAPGPAPWLPVDAKTQMTRFIEATMVIASQKSEEYLQTIDNHVKDPATSGATRECLQECKEVYETAVDDMKNTMDNLRSENYYMANVDLSAILANVDTCRDCYREMVGEQPNANFDAWVIGIASDCLDKLETVVA
ncbi:PMEI domain-containing protein [Heracleum sosnowskyi]|uniref:PMEI domain-containing protein n=1 Tax=Heracleum sosnowskyi TaxID=360622 RepID=A0AAD8M020_9APIA|nr:PMEI domain-containing protein [Heracleum sosnowskyi]